MKGDTSKIVINILAYGFIGLFTIMCLLPLLILFSASFTDEISIMTDGFALIPRKISFEAYETLFKNMMPLLRSFVVSCMLVLVGTTGAILFNSMAGYAVSRQHFRYRNVIIFYFYFSSLFSGGLISYYLLITRTLGWRDTYWPLLIPGMAGAFNVIMLKNFIKGVPDSLAESARIDGANDFTIYWKVIMPLIKPGLVSIGLYTGIGYWNSWYDGMLFLDSATTPPLQLYLYTVINKASFLAELQKNVGEIAEQPPSESLKMAVAVISITPVLIVFPFLQKQFIAGITIGAVKG